MVVGSSPVAVAYVSVITSLSSKEFLDIPVIWVLIQHKRVYDMIKTHKQVEIMKTFKTKNSLKLNILGVLQPLWWIFGSFSAFIVSQQ